MTAFLNLFSFEIGSNHKFIVHPPDGRLVADGSVI